MQFADPEAAKGDEMGLEEDMRVVESEGRTLEEHM